MALKLEHTSHLLTKRAFSALSSDEHPLAGGRLPRRLGAEHQRHAGPRGRSVGDVLRLAVREAGVEVVVGEEVSERHMGVRGRDGRLSN